GAAAPAAPAPRPPPAPPAPAPPAAPAPPPRPGGTDGHVLVAAALSGRKSSMTAYTRRGLLAEIATALRPMHAAGKRAVRWFHVVPPSADLKIPPPGPFDG